MGEVVINEEEPIGGSCGDPEPSPSQRYVRTERWESVGFGSRSDAVVDVLEPPRVPGFRWRLVRDGLDVVQRATVSRTYHTFVVYGWLWERVALCDD